MAWRAVTDRQWELIAKQLPKRKLNPKGGRPPTDDRKCFEGILWILWTGAPWSQLPERYGSKSAVHRRLSEWAESGVLLTLWRAFLDQLNDQKKVRWNECFIDAMFVSAKKGAQKLAKPSAARERSLWYWPMARVLRSEYTWRRLPRQKSNSLRKRSTK
jgi:transposase